MRTFVISFFLLCFAICSKAQVNLSNTDLNNLVALGDLHSHDNMGSGEGFANAANALRTPALNNIVTKLLKLSKPDTTLLQKQFMARPTHDELVLWYVLREIHYNRVDTTRTPITSAEVAKKVLAENIDERWLLDNYYYFFHGGIAMLFNEADLSHFNFDLNDLGFNDQTEKAIFFLNAMDGLINGRFLALQYLKKYKKVLEFSSKMPKFNGRAYFYYTDLKFTDFDWVGYLTKESYNEKHIGSYMNALIIQFVAYSDAGKKANAQEVYFNSILRKPEYFYYSGSKDILEKLYYQTKN